MRTNQCLFVWRLKWETGSVGYKAQEEKEEEGEKMIILYVKMG